MGALSVARLSLFAAIALGCAPSAAEPREKKLVVVELFTSQGCSSCPPANANLAKLRDRYDVLSLSFSVTYWDRLGWKDVFGRPEFTDRQAAYEPGLGERGPFTPQMVVNGAASGVGADPAEVDRLIAAADRLEGPTLRLGEGQVLIAKAPGRSKAADVWLARYEPKIIETEIRRGENAGRTLPHSHVVRELRRLGSWRGEALAFDILPARQADLKTAILVQEPAGRILSAVSD